MTNYSNRHRVAVIRSTAFFLVCFAMKTPWSTVSSSSILGQEVRQPVAADAYANLLNQVQSKRTVLLKTAQNLFAANQNLQKRIAIEEHTAMVKSSLSKTIPEFSFSGSSISNYPASTGSSRSSNASRGESNASRRNLNDANVTTTNVLNISDNQSLKKSIMHEAYYWKLQSTMDQKTLASVNQELADLLNQLVVNLNEFCSLVDMHGFRSEEESVRAAEITAQWLSADPSHVGGMLVRAAALRNLGQIDLALQLAFQAKGVSTPAAPMAATLVAQCLVLKGRTDDARDVLEAVIRITKASQFEEPFVLKAMIEATEDHFSIALSDARRATQGDEKSTYALLVRSLVESTTISKPEQLKTALKHARSAASQNAQDWMCMQALMFVESKAGDFKAAQRAGQKAISLTTGKRRESIEEKVAQCEQHKVPAFDWKTYIESTLSAGGIPD